MPPLALNGAEGSVPSEVTITLERFYTFLSEAYAALTLPRFDQVQLPQPAVNALIGRTTPLAPLFRPLSIPGRLKRVLLQDRLAGWVAERVEAGIVAVPDPPFTFGLLEHLRLPIDYTRSA